MKGKSNLFSVFKELIVRESDIKRQWQSSIPRARTQKTWRQYEYEEGHSPKVTRSEQTSFGKNYLPINRHQLTEGCSNIGIDMLRRVEVREQRRSESSECKVSGEGWYRK